MGMMASAGDLLTLYIGLELQSLAAYVLASFMRRDTRSAEAGLKYFVLGALAERHPALWHLAHSTAFTGDHAVRRASRQAFHARAVDRAAVRAGVRVYAGLAFKISAVPFHMWTPDVYEGAPTPVTAFFASAPKVAAMALMIRVAVEAMGPATNAWQQIVDLLRACLHHPGRRRGDRAVAISNGCWPIRRSTMSASRCSVWPPARRPASPRR